MPLYITFVDYKKAFDSIDRNVLFSILRHYGIPQEMVNAIRVLYDNSGSQVYIDGKYSPRFDVKTGILQGDVLAPFLFIIVMDYIIKTTEQSGQYGFKSHPKSGSRNPEKSVSDLEFADDAALLDDELQKAEQHLQKLNDSSLPTGLIINTDKTVFLNLVDKQTIKLNGKDLEVVDDFKYFWFVYYVNKQGPKI